MESLTDRFDSIQEDLLQIYERGETDLNELIHYWDLVRQENLLMHFARQKGLLRIGLQHLPALQVSENKAKQAIQMKIVLTSLQKSQYGNEPWTLPEVSLEVYNASPMHTLKKSGRTVTVIYDNDNSKEVPYVSWNYIYFQDETGNWHKTVGKVGRFGLYYIDEEGNEIYYENFEEDSRKYGTTGHWEVIDNAPVSTSVPRPNSPRASSSNSDSEKESSGPSRKEEPSSKRPRFGRRQGEYRSGGGTRAEADSSTEGPGIPSPGDVGSRTTTVGRGHISRLERLQAEAWDPAIIILKGRPNAMKCWRNRAKHKYRHLYSYMSTVFQWVTETGHHHGPVGGRMLISFESVQQRNLFIKNVPLPKAVTFALGNLESL
ncbi:early protein 2 [Callithrix penicillata papillomavirus type 2]|uniref:Regulatory protein E2 n=1 Tax=Callithrix penicillata papillomavirus type 2 TaxID=2704504 RepID=A0A6C0T9L5_9PAPI|nr:early protein 2 [Callithrix penicillata papillomavirus type 2]